MFQRPLICTDFADGLQRLVNFVPSLVAGGMKQIVFLHTVPLKNETSIPRLDVEQIDRAKAQLSAALQQVPTGVEVKIEVQSGRLIDTILKTASTDQADVILLGTSGRSLLTEKLFGSTTMGLVQRTTIPLLTLRPQLISTYTAEELSLRCQHLFRDLLLPYDDSDAAKYTVQTIKRLVQEQSGSESRQLNSSLRRVLMCWVAEEGSRYELTEEQQQQVVCQTLEPVRHDLAIAGVDVKLEVRRGDSVVQILAVAQESDVSAIVLSSDRLGKRLEGSLASFTGEVLRRSWHPVLFLPLDR